MLFPKIDRNPPDLEVIEVEGRVEGLDEEGERGV